jgi:glycosyltransferase involved in cell wall biosynthesis
VGSPTLSIVVPTRNRPDHASACALSILKSDRFRELVFVDQSDGPETTDALAALNEPRLRSVRSPLRGATNARNTGIDACTGELIAFTDDDCRVNHDWVDGILNIFTTDPKAAIICGRVRAPTSLKEQGFVTEFEPEVREWVGRFPPPDRDWGLTANFAVRRAVFDDIGRFDALLGVGAPLLAGEEPDFLIRALTRGYKVVNAREVEVEHLGLRNHGEQSSQLWRAYGAGTAAALMKHVRLGDRAAAMLCLKHLELMAGGIYNNLRDGKRPIGVAYTVAFFSGALSSLKFRVNAKDRLYERR